MMKRGKRVDASIVRMTLVAAIVATSGALATSRGQESANVSDERQRYYPEAIYLDQGWDHDKAQWWYYVSQGTVFMPYAWFVALEQATGDALFTSSDHLERLGFIPEPSSALNPGGLPVGFARRQLDFATRAPYQYWKGEWVGFACAACHTGQIRYHGQQIRIEGGPAHHDIETFQNELSAALVATYASEPKFRRFAARVLASGAAVTPDDLRKSFGLYLQDLAARRSLFEAAQARASEEPTDSGFGRLDAVHRGGNLLLSGPLQEARNYIPTTAPVRFPALWDTPYFDWVLYNASIRQPLARNVIEALGVGAPIDPATFLSGTVNHGVLMDNIVSIHRSLTKLQSPPWPENILGRIDPVKAQQGEALFQQMCAGCHQPIDRRTHAPLRDVAEGKSPEIAITTVPLDKVGTDPRQATNFASRVVTLEKINGPPQIAYLEAAKAVTSRIVDQWAQQSTANAQAEKEIDAGRANDFRGTRAYRARPLNGIWAMAPYLHNGSVPSLYELLLPAAQRTRIFYVGSWEFDPQQVGVISSSPFAGAFMFDTRLPGNSNAGHDYGTNISEADRLALIEFLKKL